MISVSAEYLLQQLAQYALPFARMSGLLMTMSVIGSRNFPARFRLLLALALTVIIVPTINVPVSIDMASPAGWLLMAEQTLLGIALGFATRLFLETFVIGAQVIAMQSGLGFASLVDPANGTSVPALGQFFLLLTTLLFIAADGHWLMIRILVASFDTLPIGTELSLGSIFWLLVDWARWMFAAALMMALVAVAALLLVNIAFGVMTRAAPQINVFAVGFPLTMTAGLILVWLTLAYFLPHFDGQFYRMTELVCQMAALEC